MAEQQSELPAFRQGENVLTAKIVIDQNIGTIWVYDDGDAENNIPPRVVMRLGFCGYDNNNLPLYGMLMYDENGTPQFFAGKQVNGF